MTAAGIECAGCNAINSAGARFCSACGQALTLSCTRCGCGNARGARFCDQCGVALPSSITPAATVAVPRHLAQRILESRGAIEGERKQVSVLFADLKGSMALLAGRDPEEARAMLDPLLEIMMEAVHHVEGTVNQVMGDGIMALFGAPLAHEDHAVRACYAALRMQASVARLSDAQRRAGAVPVQIRVGIHSGEVIVRAIGSDLRMDYSAIGQTTHLAARMEQLAVPGTTLITADTLVLAEGYVAVEPLGPMRVAGLEQPVPVYQLIGAGPARTRLQARATRAAGGLSSFVGRASELETLSRALDAAGQARGQIVSVVGEAGVGKSRLFHEFVHSQRTQGWLVLEAGSVSYGKATGYGPVIDLLKSYFGIEQRDDPRRMRERITGKLLALDRTLEPSLPALLALLEVLPEASPWEGLDPGQRKRAIQDAVKRLLLRESQAQPLVVVFEDLHWVDAESQAVLDALADSLPAAKLLLLVNLRPEGQHGWGQKTYCRQLRLDSLPPETAEELLNTLLGEQPELQRLRLQLIERTEGNPFFLEECVQTLVETGALVGERGAHTLGKAIETIQVPATVQVILAARIDRLAPEDKHLLQAAAVVGKDVPFALLKHTSELGEEILHESLARLQATEFVYETALFPDLEYTFKHALTHEVAYGGLLSERRRELHARVVEAIETVHAERIGEHAERLAHHAVRGHLDDKAVEYLNEAGTKALMRSGYREATGFFEQALGIVEKGPENDSNLARVVALRTGLGLAVASLKGPESQEVRTFYTRSLELCDRLGNASDRFQILFGLWNCYLYGSELARANQTASELLDVAGDKDGYQRLEAHHAMWTTKINLGRPDQAMEHVDFAQSLQGSADKSKWKIYAYHDPLVCSRSIRALAHWSMGYFDQALRAVAASVDRARQLDHPLTRVIATTQAALVFFQCGEIEAARDHAEAASRLGSEHAISPWRERAAVTLARVMVDSGNTAEALRLLDTHLSVAGASRLMLSGAMALGLGAEAFARAGQPERGLALLRTLQPDHLLGFFGPELHRLYAQTLLICSPAATDEAEARLRTAIAMAQERQMKALELRAALSLARLLAPRDRSAAREALAVVDWFTEGADVADLRNARALRDELA